MPLGSVGLLTKPSETRPLYPFSVQGERSYLGVYHFISKAGDRDSRRINETIFFSLILTVIHSEFQLQSQSSLKFPSITKKRIQKPTVGKSLDFGFSSAVDSLIYVLVTLGPWANLSEPQIALMVICTHQIRFVCDGTWWINASSLPLTATPLKPVLLLTQFRSCLITRFWYTWLTSPVWCKVLFKKGRCASLWEMHLCASL